MWWHTKTVNQTMRLLCYLCILTCRHMCAIHIFRFAVLNNTLDGAGWRFTHSYMHPFIFSCSHSPDGPERPVNLCPGITFPFKAQPQLRLGGTTADQDCCWRPPRVPSNKSIRYRVESHMLLKYLYTLTLPAAAPRSIPIYWLIIDSGVSSLGKKL